MTRYNLITILGPTATGKTHLAATLACRINGEIISADSRQVYRSMDIGTGKDYSDYIIDGNEIPCHLVDIEEPGKHFNVYRFQTGFIQAYKEIIARNRWPVLCGGSGLYIESVLKNYKLITVPPNKELREQLKGKTLDELTAVLTGLKPELHNKTDIETERRALRAIEIELYYKNNPMITTDMPEVKSLNIGLMFDRDTRRRRITERLQQRIEQGMVGEVRQLLDSGLKPQQLIYYGLEYKYITLYLTGELTYDEMFTKLEIAIHQFSKRQMTWFRGMMRRGININWIDGNISSGDKIEKILELLNE
ncbi:MAG: tRNA (adenosine(37)-N6)-dimethylallyltransferase MiaA [Prolixibacteraceae bacterium]|nr:tRNA (adenosine(37)-N6)-dimethylallyltransferase MiaA [Prolixibacteraceae bacterium]NLO02302.1 tRNA (adenosine(37)-N6)-dimethylallyltransferase MiaA [Bacteroidales bacterium]